MLATGLKSISEGTLMPLSLVLVLTGVVFATSNTLTETRAETRRNTDDIKELKLMRDTIQSVREDQAAIKYYLEFLVKAQGVK
jgi:hypothetical protein